MACPKCAHPFAPPLSVRHVPPSIAGQPSSTVPAYNPYFVPKSRLAYILLALFLGFLGIHNFYAGRSGTGLTQLLLTIFTGWLIAPLVLVLIWVLVDICAVDADGMGRPMS